MKKIYTILVVLLGSVICHAAPQYTAVTVTLTDGQGQVWANAAFSASIVAPFGNPNPLTNNGTPPITPVSGFADGTGTFTISLDDNTIITPSGSTWNFTICPNSSVNVCSNSIQVVHGNTMNLSASISADLVPIAVSASPTLKRGYVDAEVTGGQGALYWRTSDNTIRGFNGSTWITVGGGGGSSTPVWSSIINPTGNLSLNMNNFTTSFNMGATTGSTGAMFDITDSSTNTGTNYLFRVWTGTTSAANAFAACDSGTVNCVVYTGNAVFQALGNAQIVATSVLNTGPGVGVLQLGSNGSGSVSQANTVKLTGNSNALYVSENTAALAKVLLGGQLTCGTGQAVRSTDNAGNVTCLNVLGGNNTYTGANIFTGTTLNGTTTVAALTGITQFIPASGKLLFDNTLLISGALTGFGTSPSVLQDNGSSVFEIHVGTGGVATTGTVAMPTASNGWSCQITDMTTNIVTRETNFAANSVSVTSASAWTAGDNLIFNCQAF